MYETFSAGIGFANIIIKWIDLPNRFNNNAFYVCHNVKLSFWFKCVINEFNVFDNIMLKVFFWMLHKHKGMLFVQKQRHFESQINKALIDIKQLTGRNLKAEIVTSI